ncbi:MAG: hypothetical protein Q8O95_01230 [bacterium]|nr:hypothetical protein [bacterium]
MKTLSFDISMWTCPHCRRRFKKPQQRHSCGLVSQAQKPGDIAPEIKQLAQFLINKLKRRVPARAEANPTGSILIARSPFAEVRLLHRSINLAFVLNKNISSDRFERVQRISPRQQVFHLKIRYPEQIDRELLDWLETAYHLKT